MPSPPKARFLGSSFGPPVAVRGCMGVHRYLLAVGLALTLGAGCGAIGGENLAGTGGHGAGGSGSGGAATGGSGAATGGTGGVTTG